MISVLLSWTTTAVISSLSRYYSDFSEQLFSIHYFSGDKVARRGLMVFRDQQEFIDKGPDFYKQWGSYFGR
jgi:hypothetical protein